MARSDLIQALDVASRGDALPEDLACAAVSEIIDGAADPVAVAAFLTALRMKGETAEELGGAVRAVRDRMMTLDVPPTLRPILDTCGTGGDGANSVNISTATAIVVAACGVRVAKHGNRSASGNSGSAEVLTELGVRIEAGAESLTRCLEEVGITFLFAPKFHPALKHAAPVRRLLPFRTLFNLIGPLANPALPDAQLLGVTDPGRAALVAKTLASISGQAFPETELLEDPETAWALTVLRAKDTRSLFRAFIVTGQGGLDEVTLSGWTHVLRTHGWDRKPQTWNPEDFGLPYVPIASLNVSGPRDSASQIRSMLAGNPGSVRSVVLANAAAALLLVEKVMTLTEGVAVASEAIDRGDAARLLDRWAALRHRD